MEEDKLARLARATEEAEREIATLMNGGPASPDLIALFRLLIKTRVILEAKLDHKEEP